MSLFQTVVRRNKPKRNVNIITGNNSSAVYAIDKKGRAWSWGFAGFGMLGDNTIVSKSTPVSVLGTVKTFCKIISGQYTCSAIDKNGRLWAWGDGGYGILGDNTTVAKSTPVSVLGTVKTFCEIAMGQGTSYAIDKNGRAWAWGSALVGALGDNTLVSKSTPVSVLGTVKTFCKISAGDQNFVVAIDKNGRLWSWGNGTNGQLGDNTIVSKSTPVSVAGAIKTFCKVDCGGQFTSVIDKNGKVWGWGVNSFATLGDNTVTNKSTPVAIAGTLKTFCEISCGYYHAIAIDKNGRLWSWGYNVYGMLGDNTMINKSTPVSVGGRTKTFCKIGTSIYNSFAIDKNGRAWSWGFNNYGQIGNNTTDTYKTPVNIQITVRTFCEINAGNNYSLGIDKNGKIWGWGNNNFGQLGINNLNNPISPASILGATKTFCKIVAGSVHSLAIDKNGKVWAWGNGANGQLGDNTVVSKSTPVSIAGTTKTFCQIGLTLQNTGLFPPVTTYTSIALDKNGKVWGWGANSAGQLGDNTTVSKSTPVSIAGTTKTFCQISGNKYNQGSILSIDKNGRLWSWGNGTNGILGDNTVTNKSTPVSVAGTIKTFCKISSGGSNCLAIDKNGRLWAWGSNIAGNIGDNTTVNKSTPVSVAGAIKTFCEISVGAQFSSAIDKNGKVWTWGNGANGQLGDNTTVSKSTPVSIAGTTKTFCKIAAGNVHVLAVDKNGKIWGWGNNQLYQLGIPYTVTPVQICNI